MQLLRPFDALFRNPRRRGYTATVGAGYLYSAASAVVNLVLVPILINALGNSRYGVWLTLWALGQWISLAVTWLGPGIVRRLGGQLVAGDEDGVHTTLRSVSWGYGAISGLVLAAAFALSRLDNARFLGGELSPEIRAAVLLSAAWVAFQVQSNVRINLLTAAQRLYLVLVVQTAVLAASAIGAAALVLSGAGLRGVAGSYAVAALGGFVVLRFLSGRVAPPRPKAARLDFTVLREIARTAVPYAFAGAASILLSSDILLLAFLTSPVQVAHYGVIYKLVEAALVLIWRIPDSTQPYVVELDSRADIDGLRKLHRITVFTTTLLGAATAAGLFFLGKRVVDVWVGAESAPPENVIRLLAVVVLLHAFRQANLVFPYATTRMRAIGRVQLVEGALKVILTVVLVPLVGLAAAPLGTALAIAALSGWFIPRVTIRWLRVSTGSFALGLARAVLPVVTLTALASWFARELFAVDSVASLLGSLLIVAAASLFGLGLVAGRLRLPAPEAATNR